MATRTAGAGVLALVAAWVVLATVARADSSITEETLRVAFPSPRDAEVTLVARLYRPAGQGPFPLAVMNHGASRSDAGKPDWLDWYAEPSRWFAARGYATLLLMRRAYAGSGGTWMEGYGTCANPVYHEVGLETARDPSGHCASDRLVATMARWASTTTAPTLWIYAQNDEIFAPALVRRMHAAYVQAGGRAELHVLPVPGPTGHSFFNRAGATSQWGPPVREFLARLGLPS